MPVVSRGTQGKQYSQLLFSFLNDQDALLFEHTLSWKIALSFLLVLLGLFLSETTDNARCVI